MSVQRRNHSSEAPPELTGGAGFNFEDQVAAHFLVSLLTQERLLFGASLHTIEGVHWQVKDRGWLLDDLLLSLRQGSDSAFLALSIKRERMVTQKGFRADFVHTAWRQWLGIDTDAFDRNQDLLGLAVGQLAESVKNAWDDLLNHALAGNADRVARRLSDGSNAIARALFKSLHCPEDLLAGGNPLPGETVRFLSRIRLWGFDFRSPISRDARDRLKLCQSALIGEDPAQAADLWLRLQNLAFERRPHGGDVDRAGLLGKLRIHYRLIDAPDYKQDWRILDQVSAEARSSVSEALGEPHGAGKALSRPSLTLLRNDAYQQLLACIRRNRVTWLVGSGGAGKSALESMLAHRWCVGTILWLNAGTVRDHNLLTFERELQLRHPIDRLLREAPGQQSLLILDGLERWRTEALETAAKLVEIASQLDHWRILIAIRPDRYHSLRRQLTNHGAPVMNAEMVSLEPLSDIDLREIHNVFPWIGRLARRPDLAPFLCNLQVLQSVLSAFPGGRRSNTSSWVGSSDVIDELWKRWAGVDEDRHTRAGLLKRLAKLEAQNMQGSVGLSELEPTERRVVVALENLEVLRVVEERVSFVHDLIGDWARLRILVEAGEDQLEQLLVECGRMPMWSEAVRRFGERLLDQGDGGKRRWRTLIDGLPRHQELGAVTRDLLLDSLVFSSNAHAHLEQNWAHLSEDRGALLKRVLQRFLFIATGPSPHVAEIADSEDEALAVRAYWRIPLLYLWQPVLRVLAGHREDVAGFASELAAQLCTLYLSSVPASFRGRREAAQLAVALGHRARRLNAQVKSRREAEVQSAFEAALHAATDLSEEVVGLALEVAQRKADLPSAEQPDARPSGREQDSRAERARSAAAFSRRLGPLREPYPDGPLTRVDESFRAAVLDTQGLTGLMRANAIAAREVLLACCLEEPRPRNVDRNTGFSHLGTSTWWAANAKVPIYFQGPFLSFLRIDPGQGLEAILRLVNQVTSNWAESAGDQVEIVRLQLGEDLTVEWLGDQSVYGWYRDSNAPGKIVPTALMALEEWLYNHIDQGKDISRVVQTILSRSRSVAFGGILAAVGKKKPELFQDPVLRPLLTAWQLYWWDDQLARYDSLLGIHLMDWVRAGERVFNVVRDWHNLSHRKQSLLHIGIQLLLTNQEFQEHFVQIRKFWLQQLQQGHARFEDHLERMIARFDPANYSYQLGADGALEIATFQWPEALRERSEQEARLIEPDMIASAFPWKCRQRLSSGEPLMREESEAVWGRMQEFARLIGEEAELPGLDRWANAVAAGILLLLRLAENWLEQSPEHSAWCRQQLAMLLDLRRAKNAMGHAEALLDLGWSGFVAEATILLLARERSNATTRRLVAKTIVLGSNGMIEVAFKHSFKERQRLGNDWERLQNLVIIWSALRWIAVPWDPKHARLNSWARRLGEWFIEAKLSPEPVEWERVAAIALRMGDRLFRREKALRRDDEFASLSFRPVSPEDFGLDLFVVKAGFAWLPLLKEARHEQERESWMHLHLQLLAVATRRRRRIQESQELNPHYEGWLARVLGDYENWILARVAALIPQIESPEERRSVWINVLDPSVAAPDHARALLSTWFTEGRQAAGDARNFVRCWGELIQYVLDFRARQQPGDDCLYLDDTELMGLLWGALEVGKEEYQQLLGGLLPLYEKWAASALDNPRSAKLFARFLARPGAKEILRPGLRWLHEALPQLRSAEHPEEGLDEALCSALGVCWRYFRAEVTGIDPSLKRAFFDLLAWVCSRNHPAALELRDSAGA